MQLLFVRAEDDNIVHVSHTVLRAVERRDVTVERFEVEVCEPLADEKANGQPLFAGLQDLPRQLEILLVLDLVRQHPDQLAAVDGMVEVANVHFADVPASFLVVVNDALAAPKRVLSTAPWHRRAAPVIHPAQKDRCRCHDHQRVNDAVWKERNVFDLSPFSAAVVEDLALPRLSRDESLRLQKIIDEVRVAAYVGQHPPYVAPIVFVFRAKHNGFADVLFIAHPFIQESFSFWHLPRSLFAIGVFPDTFRPY